MEKRLHRKGDDDGTEYRVTNRNKTHATTGKYWTQYLPYKSR